MYHEISLRVTGFIASLLLTITAYFIILHPEFFNFDIKTAIIIIFTLSLIQSLVQLIFFIDVWKEEGPLWNLGIFISTVSIIFIIVFFSIWIMDHLNYNMQ
ncbi:MAG: cytochrome C oxidase subunit IV family protein [Parachlamydiaceae bacterium]|nr:cytochrome C oxidase subunit IV family protein [Parachlamydiaceae bacterium]